MFDTTPAVPLEHEKKILLVEDLQEYYRPIKRWLKQEGYKVTIATNLADAISKLESEHFHAAVIDLNLNESDLSNQDGMILLARIHQMDLGDVIPSVVLTATTDARNVHLATQKYHARFIFKDPDYGTELKKELKCLFDKTVKIKFDLLYEVNCGSDLPLIAGEIKDAEKQNILTPADIINEQVKDIFGKLYFEAKSIYFRKLKPGLTGASVLMVEPTLKHGMAPAQVVKIGRRDKIRTEAENYENHVRLYVPFASVQVSRAYSRNLGGISYTFMGNYARSFEEFDSYYEREEPGTIISLLEGLVSGTCRHWYDERDRERLDLRALYFQAFNLNQTKLVERILEILPGFDPAKREMPFPLTGQALLNPIAWMEDKGHGFIRPVFLSITHGDLTGRNIMVDAQKAACWLIDFYRTYRSHILRDFVILETDIKYRLLGEPSLPGFIELENTLLAGNYLEEAMEPNENLSPDLQKAAHVVHFLHHLAAKISMSVSGLDTVREDYLRSLLMGTLNVVRLRHITPERKMHALYSAHLICQQLNQLSRY